MVGLGTPFSLPVRAERMRGAEGREQGNRGAGTGGSGKKCLFSARVIPQLGMTKLEQIVRFLIACSRPPLLLIPAPPFRAPSCVCPHPFGAGRGIEGTHPPPFPCPSPFAHPPFVQAASLAPFASLSFVVRQPFHALSLSLRGRGAQEWDSEPPTPLPPSPIPSTPVTPPSPRFTPRPTGCPLTQCGRHRGAQERRGHAQVGRLHTGVARNEAVRKGTE